MTNAKQPIKRTPRSEPIITVKRPPEDAAAVWVSPKDLKGWARNPRKNDDNVARVARSIRELGFGAPIVARRENREVIAGHTRLKAAISLGLARVPVRFVDVDEHKAHLMALADNRLTELSPWDETELFSVLKDFDLSEIELAGWTEDDLAKLDLGPKDEPPAEDETPEPPADPVTKPGDVWTLGDHTLHCADGHGAPGGFGMVVTDPPYGINVIGKSKNVSNAGNGTDGFPRLAKPGVYAPIAGDDSTPEVAWLIPLGGVVIIWGGNYFPDLPTSNGWLVWDKREETGIVNSFADGELAWTNYGGPVRIHRQLWSGMIRTGEREKRQHPTQKPIALMAWCLGFGEGSVLDPYAGSGSTLIACENVGRACTAFELSPAYCDVIVQRWEALTGGSATRVSL